MRSAYLLDGQLAAEARVAELVQEALAAHRLAVALVERRPGDRTRAAVAHKVLRMPGLAQRGQRLPKSFVLQLVSDESACLQMAHLSGDSHARAPQFALGHCGQFVCKTHTHARLKCACTHWSSLIHIFIGRRSAKRGPMISYDAVCVCVCVLTLPVTGVLQRPHSVSAWRMGEIVVGVGEGGEGG